MNTIPDTILEQVCVMMNSQQKVKLTEDFVVPIGEVFSLASGAAYVSFTRDSPTEYVLASFQEGAATRAVELPEAEKLDGSLFVRVAGLSMDRMGWMREGEEMQEWDFDAFYHD